MNWVNTVIPKITGLIAKQVVIGLLMRKDGIPIAHEVFKGNMADTQAFSLVLKQEYIKVKENLFVKEVWFEGKRYAILLCLLNPVFMLG